MKLFIDDFDTKIFKKNIYKFYLDKEITLKELNKTIGQIKDGIIFCFTLFSIENASALQDSGFKLISIRNTYKLDLNSYVKKPSEPYYGKYILLDKTEALLLLQQINTVQIAKTIYRTSRYSKDKLIDKNKGLDIYINWVNNSLYNNYADQAFLIFDKSFVIGIITIKIKKEGAFIDLLGVNYKYQNQKIGTHLLKNAVTYLISKNIDNIFVITEAENIPANIFYEKNSFITWNVELVYHKHISGKNKI